MPGSLCCVPGSINCCWGDIKDVKTYWVVVVVVGGGGGGGCGR